MFADLEVLQPAPLVSKRFRIEQVRNNLMLEEWSRATIAGFGHDQRLLAKLEEHPFHTAYARHGFGDNASGGNGWWEQCAQWQAYKVFPTQQFSNEWFSGYLNNVHKHILHETPRYQNFFIQDYWTFLHGKDIIGKQFATRRLADVMIDLFVLACVISRVTASLEAKGADGAQQELQIARVFAGQVQRRASSNFRKIDENDDELIKALAQHAYDKGGYSWDVL